MQRRQFLRHAGVSVAVASTAGLAACARQPVAASSKAGTIVPPPITSGTPGMLELAPI